MSSFVDNHSISELVIEIINIFDFYLKSSAIGDQKLISVKLDHLINIAISLEKQDYHLEEFIKYLTDASNENIGFTISSEKDTKAYCFPSFVQTGDTDILNSLFIAHPLFFMCSNNCVTICIYG